MAGTRLLVHSLFTVQIFLLASISFYIGSLHQDDSNDTIRDYDNIDNNIDDKDDNNDDDDHYYGVWRDGVGAGIARTLGGTDMFVDRRGMRYIPEVESMLDELDHMSIACPGDGYGYGGGKDDGDDDDDDDDDDIDNDDDDDDNAKSQRRRITQIRRQVSAKSDADLIYDATDIPATYWRNGDEITVRLWGINSFSTSDRTCSPSSSCDPDEEEDKSCLSTEPASCSTPSRHYFPAPPAVTLIQSAIDSSYQRREDAGLVPIKTSVSDEWLDGRAIRLGRNRRREGEKTRVTSASSHTVQSIKGESDDESDDEEGAEGTLAMTCDDLTVRDVSQLRELSQVRIQIGTEHVAVVDDDDDDEYGGKEGGAVVGPVDVLIAYGCTDRTLLAHDRKDDEDNDNDDNDEYDDDDPTRMVETSTTDLMVEVDSYTGSALVRVRSDGGRRRSSLRVCDPTDRGEGGKEVKEDFASSAVGGNACGQDEQNGNGDGGGGGGGGGGDVRDDNDDCRNRVVWTAEAIASLVESYVDSIVLDRLLDAATTTSSSSSSSPSSSSSSSTTTKLFHPPPPPSSCRVRLTAIDENPFTWKGKGASKDKGDISQYPLDHHAYIGRALHSAYLSILRPVLDATNAILLGEEGRKQGGASAKGWSASLRTVVGGRLSDGCEMRSGDATTTTAEAAAALRKEMETSVRGGCIVRPERARSFADDHDHILSAPRRFDDDNGGGKRCDMDLVVYIPPRDKVPLKVREEEEENDDNDKDDVDGKKKDHDGGYGDAFAVTVGRDGESRIAVAMANPLCWRSRNGNIVSEVASALANNGTDAGGTINDDDDDNNNNINNKESEVLDYDGAVSEAVSYLAAYLARRVGLPTASSSPSSSSSAATVLSIPVTVAADADTVAAEADTDAAGAGAGARAVSIIVPVVLRHPPIPASTSISPIINSERASLIRSLTFCSRFDEALSALRVALRVAKVHRRTALTVRGGRKLVACAKALLDAAHEATLLTTPTTMMTTMMTTKVRPSRNAMRSVGLATTLAMEALTSSSSSSPYDDGAEEYMYFPLEHYVAIFSPLLLPLVLPLVVGLVREVKRYRTKVAGNKEGEQKSEAGGGGGGGRCGASGVMGQRDEDGGI